MTRRRYIVFGAAIALAVTSSSSQAFAEEKPESAAMAANQGLYLGFGPQILLPTDGGPIGGGLIFDGRYGIRLGPTVLAPGGRLGGSIISSRIVYSAMPTFRVTLPIGPLAPFALGGIGIGGLTNPGETGASILAGGGLTVHVGRLLAIGAELSWQHITGTELSAFIIGPTLQIGG